MKALVTLARGSSSQIGLLQLAFAQLMSAFQIKIPFSALIFVNFPLLWFRVTWEGALAKPLFNLDFSYCVDVRLFSGFSLRGASEGRPRFFPPAYTLAANEMFSIRMKKKASQYVTCHLQEGAHPVLKQLPPSWPRTLTPCVFTVTQAGVGGEVLRREPFYDIG